MSRNPIFIFCVVIIVAVSFVFVVGGMKQHEPTGGVYSDINSSANSSQQYLNKMADTAPAFLVPAIILCSALVVIWAMFLFRRK